MKLLKILALLGLTGVAWAGPSSPPAGNFILNVSTFGGQQAVNITSATVRGQLYLPYATANQCLQTDILKNVVSAACASGGGGASILAINQNGVAITSPTLAVNALSPPFRLTPLSAGATAQWTLDSSSVTLMGNSVNGASQLIQTTFAGALPALSAVNLTNIPSANLSGPVPGANLSNAIILQNTLQAGSTFFVSSGTLSNASGLPLRLDQPMTGAVYQGISFTQQNNQRGYFRQDNYGSLCSDLSTTCQNNAFEVGWSTSSFFFNKDGRFFASQGTMRQNAYSSVIGGSLIVGGTGNFNYTDTQAIGDGNLLVNNGIIASTMNLVGAGDGKITLTVGVSTYTVTYSSVPFTVGQCVVATSTGGALGGITCASGTGGGGGGSTLAVTAGVSRSSPTSDLMLNPQQFSGIISASSITISLGAQNASANSVLINSSNTTVTGASNIILGDKNYASGTNLTTGSNNTCVGGLSCTSLWSDASITAVGANALKVASGTTNDSAFGSGALFSDTSGKSNTAIGKNALVRNITGDNNTAIGDGACDNAGFTSSTTLTGSICIGAKSYVDASNTMAIGSTHGQFPINQPITDVYWNGRQNDTGFAGSSITWHAQASSGTDLAGGDLRIAAGQGSGAGAGGSIYLQVASAGSAGTQLNPLVNVATISVTGVTAANITQLGVDSTTLKTGQVAVGVATAAIQSVLNSEISAVGTDTTTLKSNILSVGLDTATLKTGLVAVGVDTASLKTGLVAVGVDTASLKTTDVNVGIATQTPVNFTSISANYTATSTDAYISASAVTTTTTITLDAATALKGQQLSIFKTDGSSWPVTVVCAGTDKINGSTGTFTLNAQGQAIRITSDGVSKWLAPVLQPTPLGIPPFNFDETANTSAQVSSFTFLAATYVPSPARVTGCRFINNVGGGTVDCGIYDTNGTLLSSTTVVAQGTSAGALQTINFISGVNLSPGIYYLALGSSNPTSTFKGIACPYNCSSVLANVPLATGISVSGTAFTTGASFPGMQLIVTGGASL